MAQDQNIERFLSSISLFHTLNKKQIKHLANSTTRRSYKAGEDIVRQGDPATALYVILRGRVSINKDGRELRELGSGDYFGEMALLDEYPRSATATAVEPTECLLLPRWDFIAALRAEPEIALGLLPILSQRIRSAEERAGD